MSESYIFVIIIRVHVHKYELNNSASVKRFDIAHICMVDRLGHEKSYWVAFFFSKMSFYFKEVRNLPNSVKIVI